MIKAMIRVNIHEAKARLSWCLERVVAGDEVLICRHNRPVAALRAIREQPRRRRQLGHAKGRLVVPSSFFDVLPEEELAPFDEASRELRRPVPDVPAVAETKPHFSSRRRQAASLRKPGGR